MARPPKFPGLQARFESAIVAILTKTANLKGRELFDAIDADHEKLGISDEECSDLGNNFANYVSRAKAAGVLTSGGPWGGYSLVPNAQPAASAALAPASQNGDGETAKQLTTPRQHWESFLHLPVTVALSDFFAGRVVSLPTASDPVRWGNPDMLMLRASALASMHDVFRDDALDAATFKKVDATPECVLASIELKGGLDRNRALMFQAIAEAAANSRWANEAWLVFVDWEPDESPLDNDVLSLARSTEIGVLEVRVPSVEDNQHGLRTIVHQAAPIRPTLRINELNTERTGVLKAAQALLREWDTESPTFLDVDHVDHKMRVLLEHALKNLRAQKGFTGERTLTEAFAPLVAEDTAYVATVLDVVLRAVAIAAGTDLNPKQVVEAAGAVIDDVHVRKTAEALRKDLDALANHGIAPKG